MRNYQRRCYGSALFVGIAGTLWGSMGFFVRGLNAEGLAAIDVVGIRAAVTAVLMALVLLVYDRRMFRIRLRDLWCFLGTGILSIIFFNYCYFRAIAATSLSVAAVLLYTAPAIVMVLSRFLFGEKFSKIKLVSLAATFAGCVLVTGALGGGQVLDAKGLLLGLGAGLGYALYSIFSRFALERGYHSLTISFYTFLIAAAGTCFLTDMGRVLSIGFGSMRMTGYVLVYALASTVVPYILYTVGLTQMENGRASIIASIEPVVATLLGIMLYHEQLTMANAAGMLLVLGGIVLCNFSV